MLGNLVVIFNFGINVVKIRTKDICQSHSSLVPTLSVVGELCSISRARTKWKILLPSSASVALLLEFVTLSFEHQIRLCQLLGFRAE